MYALNTVQKLVDSKTKLTYRPPESDKYKTNVRIALRYVDETVVNIT